MFVLQLKSSPHVDSCLLGYWNESLESCSGFPMKQQYDCHPAKQWASRHQSHPSLRLYHTCPANPSLEETLVSTNPLCPSWDWQPGAPLLTTPKGTTHLAPYVNGAPAQHNLTGIHRERCATEVVLTTKGVKVSMHLPWPSHDWQSQLSGNMWEVNCPLLVLTDQGQAKPEDQGASPPAPKCTQSATYKSNYSQHFN